MNLTKSVVSGSSWLFSKATGDDGDNNEPMLRIVDENNNIVELEGFLSFEMANNRFMSLIRKFLADKHLSFSQEDGMMLNQQPLFDTNSLVSGESQLVLMVPQDVSLEECPLNDELLLSHFVISSELISQDETGNTSYFSLNQIIGSFNTANETVEVLKNPHTDSTEATKVQILREAFVRIDSYEYPVRLLLLSDPIWIPKVSTPLVVIKPTPIVEEVPIPQPEEEQLTLDQRFRKNYNHHQSNSIRTSVKKYVFIFITIII